MRKTTAATLCAAEVPAYLSRTYHWAYLNRGTLGWLDRSLVVGAILWGNAGRLVDGALAEFHAGQRLLQAGCVYGDFSRRMANHVGENGSLDVVDVAALQIANARRKLAGLKQVQLRQGDLANAGSTTPDHYDGVCCFFLLHEVPEIWRRGIVDNLLAAVRPGGKIVFVDYHRPQRWHPLRPLMSMIFHWLEPYAPSLFEAAIESRSHRAANFTWTKTTCFGGLYQKLVGVRLH